jgi:hypothetical protein
VSSVATTGVGVTAPVCSDERVFRNNIDHGEYKIAVIGEILRDRYPHFIVGIVKDAVFDFRFIEQE